MKKIVGLFLFAASLYGISYSQCPNANFSTGTINGNWSGTTGTYSATNGVYGATGGMVLGTTNENTYATDMGRQTLITQSQTDPETGHALNELPPGGGYAVRLGNPRSASCDGGNAQEEQISYTYTPTSTSCIFTYQYAVVLHDPGASASHTQYTRPSFVIQILSSSGALIDSACGYYSVTAVAGIPGFVQCSPDPLDACDNSDDVLWKDWTSVSIDLTSQIGSSVTINFATRDCNPSGHAGKHFGYAYLTCNCGSFTLAQQCTGTSDSVTAPAGYAVYQWSYKNTLGIITNTNTGTVNTIIINPVPNGDTITCVCTSVTGCQFQYKLPLSINVPVFTPAAPTICAGATANITASGIGTYTYQWSTGGSGASISVTPPRDTTYSVTATAPGGCSSSASVPVTVNPLPAGSTTSTPATCGNNNGTITVNTTTGTSPFTYNWSTTPAQTTVTASNLGAGSYIVTVTDANSCSATITGAITSPSGITITTSQTPEYCGHSNGTATVNATGGSGPLSYTWSTTPVQTTATATGLSGGLTYTVTVTDGVCPVTAQFTIASVAGPSVHIDNIKDETCSLGNGSAAISAFGGTPPFTYAWSGTTQTTPTITGLSAGTYSITITDSNNCTANSSLVIRNFPPPTVQMSFSPSTCNLPNGWVAVAVSSGTPPFTYTWNPSGPNSDSVINITGGIVYSITVTDSTGCVATSSSSVPNLPGPLVNGVTVSESCAGMSNGSINTTITDPASPYTFKWSNNDSTQNISNLPGGVTYTVTVTDAAGCTNTASFLVGTHPIITLALSSSDSHCNQPDGSINLVVTGGTPPTFTYIWSNSATTQNLNNIIAGTYTVTVTDGFCTSTGTDSLISLPGQPYQYQIRRMKHVQPQMEMPLHYLLEEQLLSNILGVLHLFKLLQLLQAFMPELISLL